MSMLPKDLENMLGTKEEFEKARDEDDRELEELMEENNQLDYQESMRNDL